MVRVPGRRLGKPWGAIIKRIRKVELRSGEIVVREWRAADAEALALLANDRSVWLGLRDAFPHPYGIDDAQRFLAMSAGMQPPAYFAIEVGSRLAGGIGFTRRTDVERVGAEVGYWLGSEFRGLGVATAALRLITSHAFCAHPELRRLYAVPFVSNPASARVLEKAGYRLEGTLRQSAIKDGRILDQWMYAILRDDVPEGAP
jgi:ribosomal-protein-alanine N-acetyltransferase